VTIFGVWFTLRILFWQSPFAPSHPPSLLAQAALRPPTIVSAQGEPALRAPEPATPAVPRSFEAPIAEPLPSPWLTQADSPDLAALPAAYGRVPARRIVGHQLLLAAALTHMELAQEIGAYFAVPQSAGNAPAASAGGSPSRSVAVLPRWTGDAWLLLRNGSSGPLAPGEPSYGRSQAGGVLRYRLAPASGHRPVVYVRATRALAGPRESEVAAGLAARPIAGVPLSVAGEMRISEEPAGREIRPAAFAVTEFPPVKLPRGLRAEAYVQAGYVGGRFATAFVDGQARIDAPVVRLGPKAQLRAGGGVWGGAQRRAARLDIGPSAAVSFPLGDTLSRVAVDYRVRVAGDAAPRSGPALTISAGF
jgi:hypothetical protein